MNEYDAVSTSMEKNRDRCFAHGLEDVLGRAGELVRVRTVRRRRGLDRHNALRDAVAYPATHRFGLNAPGVQARRRGAAATFPCCGA